MPLASAGIVAGLLALALLAAPEAGAACPAFNDPAAVTDQHDDSCFTPNSKGMAGGATEANTGFYGILGKVLTHNDVLLGVSINGNIMCCSGSPSAYPEGQTQASDDLEGQPVPPPSGSGRRSVGIRLVTADAAGVPYQVEGMVDGCACSSWSVDYAGGPTGVSRDEGSTEMTQAYPQPGAAPLVAGLKRDSWQANAGNVTVRHHIGTLGIEHHFSRSPRNPSMFDVAVTLRNLGDGPLDHVRYARGMDWDVQPTSYHEHITLDALSPPPTALVASCNNGFGEPVPFAVLGAPNPFSNQPASCLGGFILGRASCPVRAGPPAQSVFDAPPCDQGATFLFDFGTIPAGYQRRFHIHYGATPTESAALDALRDVEAQVWSIAQPSTAGGPGSGSPATFMFAFSGVDRDTPPTAAFSVLPADGCEDSSMAFRSGSWDAEGPLEATWWTFGDGATAAGPEAVHTFGPPATYTVTLHVRDLGGLVSTASIPIVWGGAKDCCPAIDAVEPRIARLGATVTVRFFGHDHEDGPLAYRVLPMPWGATVEGDTFRWRPGPRDIGVAWFEATVDDGRCTASAKFRIVVQDAPLDRDQDGVADLQDNCPSVPNPDQLDGDGDGDGDACDLLASLRSPLERPAGGVGSSDLDRDGIGDLQDNCPADPNRGQEDLDLDGSGDACDDDLDGDGVPQAGRGAFLDDCPRVPDPGQEDSDRDGIGDACGPAAGRRAFAPAGAASPGLVPGGAWWPWALALAGLAALALAAGRRAWPLAVAAFSRLQASDLLEHPTRARIVAVVGASPGIHVRELQRTLDVAPGNLAHHLLVLQRARLLHAQRGQHFTALYVAQATPAASGPALSTPARKVREAWLARPDASTRELAAATGLTSRAVRHHLRRLRSEGLDPRAGA